MKRNKILVFSFLFIIFSVLINYPIKYILISANIIKFEPGDNWIYYTNESNTKLGKINDKVLSLETNINNRTTNYFPFYKTVNQLFYQLNIKIDSLYLKNIFLKTNTDSENVFYNLEDNFYFLTNNYSSNELENRLNNQVVFYNNLNEKYPNINLYIYAPLRYEINNIDNKININNYMINFENKLNKDINFNKLESKTTQEYLKYFYKTDHHYNACGAQKAYSDILKMMNIYNEKKYDIKVIKNPYYGSMANGILNTNVSDELTDIIYDDTIKSNIKDDKFKPQKIKNTDNIFYDFYIGYFNGQYDEIIYLTDDNNKERNLLIFSDSMAWQIDYLLANNFNKTYVINLRYGKWKTKDLILNDYIKQNNITDILFLQEAETEIFDIYNHNLIKRVVL